jgi:hypothetical protein
MQTATPHDSAYTKCTITHKKTTPRPPFKYSCVTLQQPRRQFHKDLRRDNTDSMLGKQCVHSQQITIIRQQTHTKCRIYISRCKRTYKSTYNSCINCEYEYICETQIRHMQSVTIKIPQKTIKCVRSFCFKSHEKPLTVTYN